MRSKFTKSNLKDISNGDGRGNGDGWWRMGVGGSGSPVLDPPEQ